MVLGIQAGSLCAQNYAREGRFPGGASKKVRGQGHQEAERQGRDQSKELFRFILRKHQSAWCKVKGMTKKVSG